MPRGVGDTGHCGHIANSRDGKAAGCVVTHARTHQINPNNNKQKKNPNHKTNWEGLDPAKALGPILPTLGEIQPAPRAKCPAQGMCAMQGYDCSGAEGVICNEPQQCGQWDGPAGPGMSPSVALGNTSRI